MLVDERLPKKMHIQEVSQKQHSQAANDNTTVWQSLSQMPQDELAATIRTKTSEFTAWPELSDDLGIQDRRHEMYRRVSDGRVCDEFLNSNAYQGWKNRKTRGPSLLYVSGSGMIRSDNHCCIECGTDIVISCNW